MTAILRALSRATEQFREFSDTPRLDAELLMAAALGMARDRLILSNPNGQAPDQFYYYVERRLQGEPVAYITGRKPFWTIDLAVGPGVLIPRPDSETLIIAAVEFFGGPAGPKQVLDLGTGPGTLLLAALDQWPGAIGLGIDSSETALYYAGRNAERLGLDQRATFRVGNWAEGIQAQFDLILCNPPYVASAGPVDRSVAKYEPAEALFAGPDGLDDYRRLAPAIGGLLAPGGLAAIEIGFDQEEAVSALLVEQGLNPSVAHDLAGRPRALLIKG